MRTAYHRAIRSLGGQVAAAAALGRSQSSISESLALGRPTTLLAMRIEILTQGRFRAEDLRPDLAKTFRAFKGAA